MNLANETTDSTGLPGVRGFFVGETMSDCRSIGQAAFRPKAANDDFQGHAQAEPAMGLLSELLGRLSRIEIALGELLRQKTVKDWYTTEEVAVVLGKAPFTVREWCRHRRVHATKRDCGRGNSKEWIISREELMRIQTEGLLPEETPYRHVR